VEERDWLFLNFAPIGNETRYHSPGDDLASVDLATLQHMGDQLMEVGTALGTAATPNRANSDLLFMNLGTRWLFTFPALPLLLPAFLAGLFFRWLVKTKAEEKRSQVRRVLPAMLLLLFILLVPVALAWAGLGAVGTLREGQFWRAHQVVTELAIYAGVIAAGLLLLAGMKRWTVPQLRRAWCLLFVGIGMGFSIAAPGALVYFLLPPLVFLLGTELNPRWRHAETLGAVAAAALLYLTLGAALGLVQDLINSGALWALALMGGLVLMPWLIEARPLLEGWHWSRIAPAALAFATLAWVPAALAPAYSADRQQQWTTQYVLEAGKPPRWSIVNDRKSLPPTFDRFGSWTQGQLPFSRRLRWIAAAPAQPGFAQPGVEVLSAAPTTGNRRIIRLRVRTNGADVIDLASAKEGAFRAAGFGSELRSVGRVGGGSYSLTCTGRSCDGQVATIITGPEPLDLRVTGTHWRLPPAAAPLLAAKPNHARPQYLPDATILFSRLRV
jgi:hypothetical protein